MKKIKVAEATSTQLDWLVARCVAMGTDKLRVNSGKVFIKDCDTLIPCKFSTDWAQGGPIVEREKINLVYRPDINCVSGEVFPRWIASAVTHGAEGSTPLIAAMRCYVASKLGEEVDLPEELS